MKKQGPSQRDRKTTTSARDLKPAGFWNTLPADEERGAIPAMEQHYRSQGPAPELRPLAWINVRELTLFLGITYSAAAFARLALLFLDWR